MKVFDFVEGDEMTAEYTGMAGVVVSVNKELAGCDIYSNPKWGGLSGCLYYKARNGCDAVEDAHYAAACRLRIGLALSLSTC